jgi:hypothetical protein
MLPVRVGSSGSLGTFFQQQPSQGTQVVQQTAAGRYVLLELLQLVDGEAYGIVPARGQIRALPQVRFGALFCLFDGPDQKAQILVGAFNAVEGRFRSVVQENAPFSTSRTILLGRSAFHVPAKADANTKFVNMLGLDMKAWVKGSLHLTAQPGPDTIRWHFTFVRLS